VSLPVTEPEGTEQTGPLRLIIADDEEDIRILLINMLDPEPSLEVVGVATNAAEAVELAKQEEPAVAILDWMMPGGGGQAAKEIKALCPATRVVAFTSADPTAASYDMLGSGAVAFLEKRCTSEELIAGIHSAMRW
jgi:DNA-binding NarL/FixJ family response regulator